MTQKSTGCPGDSQSDEKGQGRPHISCDTTGGQKAETESGGVLILKARSAPAPGKPRGVASLLAQ
eukprot:6180897-Pleurochrysis_carterae.AAC.1